MQNPLENFLLNLAEKIQTEKEYKEIVKNSESVDVNKDVFAGFIEGIANTIKENVKNEPTEEKPSSPDPLDNFLSTLGEKLKNLPEKKKEEEPVKENEPVVEPVEEPVETKPENEPIKSEENETPDAFAGFVNNLANILKKTPEQKTEQPVENEKPKEQVNDYVKVLSNNKKVKTPEIKNVEKKPEENEETPDIKKFVANFVTKELESFKNDLTEKYLKKAAVLSEYAGGGGSVAVQYANGGVMNGDLNVSNVYPNNANGSIGSPSNRWDKIYANQVDSLSSNIVIELSGFYVDGDFTVNGTISAIGGDSNQWNSTYTSLNTNSGKYDSNWTTTNTNSAAWSNWQSVSGNYALGSQYVKLSGDTMTGTLSAPKIVIRPAVANALLIETTTAPGQQDTCHIVVRPISGARNISPAINLRASGGSGEIYDGYICSANGIINVGGSGVSTIFRVTNGNSGPSTGSSQFSVNTLNTVNVDIANSNAAAAVLRVTGSTAQTGNLTVWRNVTPTTLAFITPTGAFNTVASVSSQSVMYASGGDSNQWNSNYSTTNSNSANWSSAYTTLCSTSAFRISNTITAALFPNGYTFSSSDTGKTYHVDTRLTPVSVLLPSSIPNDFSVTLITLGTNNMHVSSSQMPMLCATGTRVNFAFASTFIYKYDDLFWGLGSLI